MSDERLAEIIIIIPPLSSPSAFSAVPPSSFFDLIAVQIGLCRGKQQTHSGTALFTRYTRAPTQRHRVMKCCNNRLLEMSLQLRDWHKMAASLHRKELFLFIGFWNAFSG